MDSACVWNLDTILSCLPTKQRWIFNSLQLALYWNVKKKKPMQYYWQKDNNINSIVKNFILRLKLIVFVEKFNLFGTACSYFSAKTLQTMCKSPNLNKDLNFAVLNPDYLHFFFSHSLYKAMSPLPQNPFFSRVSPPVRMPQERYILYILL